MADVDFARREDGKRQFHFLHDSTLGARNRRRM